MKKVVSLLITLILCLSCSVAFVGCQNNDNSVDGSGGQESVFPEPEPDPAKEIEELDSADTVLKRNAIDISLLDWKESQGNVLKLLFKDITVGMAVKYFIDTYDVGTDGTPNTELNLYKDGYWKSLKDGALKFDEASNSIFNHVLFSGEPLALTSAQLGLMKNNLVLDGVVTSLTGKKFSANSLYEKKTGGAYPSIIDTIVASGVLKNTLDVARPLALMTVGEFNELITEGGAPLEAKFMGIDIDSYVSSVAELSVFVLKDPAVIKKINAVKDFVCDAFDGPISNVTVNKDMPTTDFIDDIYGLVKGTEKDEFLDLAVTTAKKYIGGTISAPTQSFGQMKISDVTALLAAGLKKNGVSETDADSIKKYVDNIVGGTVSEPEYVTPTTVETIVNDVCDMIDRSQAENEDYDPSFTAALRVLATDLYKDTDVKDIVEKSKSNSLKTYIDAIYKFVDSISKNSESEEVESGNM